MKTASAGIAPTKSWGRPCGAARMLAAIMSAASFAPSARLAKRTMSTIDKAIPANSHGSIGKPSFGPSVAGVIS